METKKMTEKELKNFILAEATKIISKGNPTDVKMNELDRVDNSDGSAYVYAKEKGGFEKKTDAPVSTPKEYVKTKDPVDVKMTERSEGHDEKIATATKIEGSKSKKTSPDYAKGQAKPEVESKTDQPKVSKEGDPTQEGGKPGGKTNEPEMNSEDKESKETTPKTQVVGSGEIGKEGFSKGQTDKKINTKAENEKDDYEEKLRKSIETIQLPERFENKKALLEFVNKQAIELLKEEAQANQLKPGSYVQVSNDIDKEKKYQVQSINGDKALIKDDQGKQFNFYIDDLVF